MEDRLKETFACALDMEVDEIEESISVDTFPDWDSLAHLNLVSELERKFKIKITMDEVMEMTDFQKVKEVVARHLENTS